MDLFADQCGPIVKANAIEGPLHPELDIAMDMSIQLKAESGALCTLSLPALLSGAGPAREAAWKRITTYPFAVICSLS